MKVNRPARYLNNCILCAFVCWALLIWLLNGCNSSDLPSAPTDKPNLATKASLTATVQEYRGEIAALSTSVAPMPLATEQPQIQTREVFLPHVGILASTIALSNKYLYFDSSAGILCRVPLSGGKAEIVMVSEYWNSNTPIPTSCYSTLSKETPIIFGLQQSDEWFLFLDNAIAQLYTPYTIYSYHMPTGEIKKITQDDDFSSLSDYAVADEWAVIVTLDFLDNEPECQGNSIVTMINLATEERQELYRECIHNTFYYDPFAGVALTDEWIALVRRYSDAMGGNSEIVLWNRQTNEQQVVSGNEYSRFPSMSGDWLAWQAAPENLDVSLDSPFTTVLYQISTGRQQRLTPAYGTDEPHITDGRWLYWRKLANPEPWQTTFDLTTGQMYTFTTDIPASQLFNWTIHNDTIAWSLHQAPGQDGFFDGYVRWRTGADPTVLMTANPPDSPTWWQPGESYRTYGLSNLDLDN